MSKTMRSAGRAARAAAGMAACLAAAAVLAAAPERGTGEFDCLIEPSQTLEIRSPVSGLIERVHAERGGSVKRGAPLVTLASSVERATVELARFKAQMEGQLQSSASRLEQAESKWRRRSDLAERSYVSMQDRDDAAAERAVAQADALAAGENRQLARLELAYDQALHAGELAEIGENKPYILKLALINPLRVKVILPVAMYARVKLGLRAEIVPEKPLDERQWAVVTEVDKVLDAASGTFQVRLSLPNPNGALPGGLRCRARLPGLPASPG
jgi:multidrug efflux pump subunit AcrA (membrane-fusion protein)